MQTAITGMSIMEATRLMAAGDLSSVEVADACLSRIDEANAAVNTVVTLDREGALRQAADAARKKGEPVGPLHGIPFTVKDNIETAGMRTAESHPPDPKPKILVLQRRPVIQRVAPELAGGGEVIRRHTGDNGRKAVLVQQEEIAVKRR